MSVGTQEVEALRPAGGKRGEVTYLDLGQVLLVRLFFNPWVLGHLAGELFGKSVKVGLVEQALVLVALCSRVTIRWP